MGQKERNVLDFVKQQCYFYGFCSRIGLSECEVAILAQLLATATDTDVGETKFPDFICDSGWIEHFAITSGEISGERGYKNLQLENEQLKNLASSMNDPGSIRFTSISLSPGGHEYLEQSLKTAWNNHIESFKKSRINKDTNIGVFLIEVDDRCIITHFSDSKGSLYRSPYAIYFDMEILDFIYGSRDIVQYVIAYHKSPMWVEIISTSDIPKIKSSFPPDFIIRFDGVDSRQGSVVFGADKKGRTEVLSNDNH